MRSGNGLVAWAALACGCTGWDLPREVVEAAPAFGSGARLTARYVDVDGARVFDGWHDSERGEDCEMRFVPEPDGGVHCLPVRHAVIGAGDGERFFADAACSEPLALVDDALAASDGEIVIIEEPFDTCAAGPRVYALGEQVGGGYFRAALGQCQPHAGARVHRVGAPIPLDRFVRAEEVVEARGGRIAALRRVAEDGAFRVVGGYDLALSAPVLPNHGRWVPRQVAFSGVHGFEGYADARCSQPLATKAKDSALCPITTVIEFVPVPGCDNRYVARYHGAGAPVADAQVFVPSAAGCQPAVGGSTLHFVTVAEELHADQFAPVGLATYGAGRVQVEYFSEDGEPALLPSGALFDALHGQPCVLARADDLVRRCMPPFAVRQRYRDAACSERVYAHPVGPCQDDAPVPRLISLEVGDAAGGSRAEARRVGAPLDEAFERFDDVCLPADHSDERYHALGARMPAATFPPTRP